MLPTAGRHGRQVLDRHSLRAPLQPQFLENSRGQIGQLAHPADVAVGDIFMMGQVEMGDRLPGFQLSLPAPEAASPSPSTQSAEPVWENLVTSGGFPASLKALKNL